MLPVRTCLSKYTALAGDFGCYNNKDGGCSLEYKINRVFKTSSDCCLGDGHWYKQDGLEECTQCAGKQLPFNLDLD